MELLLERTETDETRIQQLRSVIQTLLHHIRHTNNGNGDADGGTYLYTQHSNDNTYIYLYIYSL